MNLLVEEDVNYNFQKRIYKNVDANSLEAHIFLPEEPKKSAPAMVYFHGGGWIKGEPSSGYTICQYFAKSGYVSASIEYRLGEGVGTAIADAKSAVAWLRKYADFYKINKDKILVVGTSAGGHLAFSTFIVPGFEDESIGDLSYRPNAVIGISPFLNPQDNLKEFKTRIDSGVPDDYSPYSQLTTQRITSLIFHGNNDSTIPYEGTAEFVNKARSMGWDITLVTGKGLEHDGFTNTPQGRELLVSGITAFLAQTLNW